MSISAETTSVRAGATLLLTAIVKNNSNTAVVWSVDGINGGAPSVGSITPTGIYSAPAVPPDPNTVTITATIAEDTTKSSSLVITVLPQIAVTIEPGSAKLRIGKAQQFVASVTGNSNGAVKWAVNNVEGGNATVGTISPLGLYTAPPTIPTPNTVTITATSVADNSKSASANATLTALPPTPTLLTITSESPLRGTVGSAYLFPLMSGGGTAPYGWESNFLYSYSNNFYVPIGIRGGTLTSLSQLLYSADVFPLDIGLTDAIPNQMAFTGLDTVRAGYELTIDGATNAAHRFTNSPSDAVEGAPYSFRIDTDFYASCNTENLSIRTGFLPPGLVLDQTTGNISGTPQAAGDYSFTLEAIPPFREGFPACTVIGSTGGRTFTLKVVPSASSPSGSSNWKRQNSGNAVLTPSSIPDWDDFAVGSPSVIRANGELLMFYEGEDSISHTFEIGRATSSDGVAWTKSANNPVLTPGPPGAWDSLEVRFPVVQFDGATYRMWYWGWDGNTSSSGKIGLAISPDGVLWTKSASNPVFGAGLGGTGYVPGSIIFNNGVFTLWYSNPSDRGGFQIGTATSVDGLNWMDRGAISLQGFSWAGIPFDASVWRPSVIFHANTYQMWISMVISAKFAQTGSTVLLAGPLLPTVGVGYATSADGVNWIGALEGVLPIGPKDAFDRPSLGNVTALVDGDVFHMWYTGGVWYEQLFAPSTHTVWIRGSIGYATSQSLIEQSLRNRL